MKKILSATETATLLQREFARLKPVECKVCTAPVPYWGPGINIGTGYWYLKMISPCEFHCNQVISKIWSEITDEYEIQRSEAESGQTRFRGAQHEKGRRLKRQRPTPKPA